MNPTGKERQPAARRLGLWDTASVIVGIIVGVGIYETPGKIFSNSPGPWPALALWAAGGLLSLVGALCFAELAGTYPRSGGEYVYLTRAFGRAVGFLFAWAQLVVIRTGGGIAVVAYIFADYAGRMTGLPKEDAGGYLMLAVLPIVALTAVNVVGVTFGKTTQNLLTGLKVLGIAGILVAGFAWARPAAGRPEHVSASGVVVHAGGDWLVLRDGDQDFSRPVADSARVTVNGADRDRDGRPYQLGDLKEGTRAQVLATPGEGGQVVRVRADVPSPFGGLALALIFVLWTYAGWHEGGYVAAEVRNPRRNLPLALVLGTAAVTVLYLLVNLAYLNGLGYQAAADSPAVAADVLALALGAWGAWAMSLLIVLSALGALNGMIFTSSRIFAEMGADHPLFAPLGRWHAYWKTPVLSLLLQGGLSVAVMVVMVLLARGQDGFDVLLKYTAPVFWVFFLLTGLALFVLRSRDPAAVRPFKVPGYPVTPLLFCGCCGFMLYASINYARAEALFGLAILAAGVPLYVLSECLRRGKPLTQPRPPQPEGEELVTACEKA